VKRSIPGFYNSLEIEGNPLPFSFISEETGDFSVLYKAANGEAWVTEGEIYITVLEKPVVCEPGIMPDDTLCVCAGDTFQTTATGAVPMADETLTYVLHDGNDSNLGTIFAENANGNFINNNAALYNQLLCISAVIKSNTDSVRCISNCQPVILYAPIKISSKEICAEDKATYDVSFMLSGGAPQYPGSKYTYTITGDLNEQGLSANESYTIDQLTSGDNYTITVVNDGKDCSASFTSDVIDCKKLPISLIAFEGEALEAGNFIKWSTASEIENDYFQLEASSDGIQFNAIHTKAGAGTISEPQHYEYLHRNAPPGETYYRLSQTDFDGIIHFVGAISVFRGESTHQQIQLQPNPVYEELLISFNGILSGNVSIQIKDLMGRIVAFENMTFLQEMSYLEQSIDVHLLAVGLYVLELKSDNQVVRKKFIKR